MTPVDLVLGKLANYKRVGPNAYQARCPAHEDNGPSLSIAEGADGKALLHCHAGCSFTRIIGAMDLKPSDTMGSMPGILPKKKPKAAKKTSPASPKGQTFETSDLAIAHLEKKNGPATRSWQYSNTDGEPVGFVVRWDKPGGGKDIRPVSVTPNGWVIGGMPEPRPLFDLPQIFARPEERIWLVEGEPPASATKSLGLLVTTSPHGAKSAGKTDWGPLLGRQVVASPDNDEPGRKYIEEVFRLTRKLEFPPVIWVITLPDVPEGGDMYDFVEARRAAGFADDAIRAELDALADAAPMASFPTKDSTSRDKDGGSKRKGERGDTPSQATTLVNLAEDADLFHAPGSDGEPYATVPVGDHRETYRLSGREFKRWLCGRYWAELQETPGSEAVQSAINTLAGNALHGGEERPVFVRLAEHKSRIYLDLGDKTWRAVEVDRDGWRIVTDPPVRFVRASAMQAIPEPVRGGSLLDLRPLINAPDDRSWRLFVSWLIAALNPRGPYPLLAVSGEQGSAKSTTCRILRNTIDPNGAPLRAEPHDARDLMIAATRGLVIALDNLSYLPPWLSDALCRLSTGGGFATRALYTDSDECIFDAQRPIILNGIEEVATRPDLLDRSLCVVLPAIPENQRRTEAELNAAFQRARPGILGALLDAVAVAIRDVDTVQLSSLPRMADFARWATAAEPGLGWPTGTFMATYRENVAGANELALDASIVWPVLQSLLSGRVSPWVGTASELLDELEKRAPDTARRQRGWPKSGRGMRGALDRIAPNLRRIGVNISFEHREAGTNRRLIEIGCLAVTPSAGLCSTTSDDGRDDRGGSCDGPERAQVLAPVHCGDCGGLAPTSTHAPVYDVGPAATSAVMSPGPKSTSSLLTSPPATTSLPDVPTGWTSQTWATELRGKADRCEGVNPDQAEKFRRQADVLEAAQQAMELATLPIGNHITV